MYSLEVDEDVFGRTLLPTQTASSLSHLVVDVVKADGGALPLLARTTVNLPQNHIQPHPKMGDVSIKYKEGGKEGTWCLEAPFSPSSIVTRLSDILYPPPDHKTLEKHFTVANISYRKLKSCPLFEIAKLFILFSVNRFLNLFNLF